MNDVVILGAGIQGLCAAFTLRRRGRGVTVIDRFPAGHDRGGSHGAARITRSSYHDRRYVELARRAHQDGWPRLEAELGQKLVHSTPGVFFGRPHGLFAAFLSATLGAGVNVEQIDLASARRTFPLLRFEADDSVMMDHTAGVLFAEATMAGLRQWLQSNSVEILDSVTATRLHAGADAVCIETSKGKLRARAVVVATGAWLADLLPEWRVPIRAIRQQVGYLQVAAPPAAISVGTFPVWCRIGQTAADFVYGLPEFARPGLKLARHQTVGPGQDPDAVREPIDLRDLEELARARLQPELQAVLATEHCMYAVAPEEELQVVHSRMDRRIVAVAACSGHGFKFGPVIGEQVADLVGAR